jgi:NAD(P)-dependent dehydrogenase (short-subunit alcohol dehydrogenase family)
MSEDPSPSTSRSLSSLQDLSNRVAVVSGGAGWLGTAIAAVLAELGAHVFVASRNLDSCKAAAQRLSRLHPGRASAVQVDISCPESVVNCFGSVVAQTGRLDILINNAHAGVAKPFDVVTLAEWNEVLATTLTGYFLCTRQAVEHMQSGGGGVIVNISSMYAMVAPDFSIYEGTPFSSSPAYGAAKAGVLQLTRYCACNFGCHNIRVNALSLGPFPGLPAQQNQHFMQALARKNPLGRIGAPGEVKGAIAFLATDASSFMTGQNLVVDGGWTAW